MTLPSRCVLCPQAQCLVDNRFSNIWLMTPAICRPTSWLTFEKRLTESEREGTQADRHQLHAGPTLRPSLNPPAPSRLGDCSHPHFTDGKTEAAGAGRIHFKFVSRLGGSCGQFAPSPRLFAFCNLCPSFHTSRSLLGLSWGPEASKALVGGQRRFPGSQGLSMWVLSPRHSVSPQGPLVTAARLGSTPLLKLLEASEHHLG